MSSVKKILIADDEPDILEIIQFNLQAEGYEVITAKNGDEAIEFRLQALNSGEHRIDHLDRRHRARGDQCAQFDRCFEAEFFLGHRGRPFSSCARSSRSCRGL